MRKIERISIGVADRERLERLVRDRNTPQKVVWRARIVLLASDGLTAEGIAAAVGKSLLTVRRWRQRYLAKGVDGLLKDATRPSRVKPLPPDKVKRVVHMTLHAKPPNATHWSVRSMAAATGISYSSVQRIWKAHGLKPHLVETFKISRDKNFAAKVEDVVGLGVMASTTARLSWISAESFSSPMGWRQSEYGKLAISMTWPQTIIQATQWLGNSSRTTISDR